MSRKNEWWKKDKRLSHWLAGRPETTVRNYLVAFRQYSKFRGMSAEELLKEKWKDQQQAPMDQGAVEDRIKEFYKYLTEEYQLKFKDKKGLSPKSALVYVAAIADFYRRHNMPLNIKLTQVFKKGLAGRPANETEKMSAEQIEKLAYYAPTLRDKAFIWTMFQSGSDVSTVCSLNWGHVAKEIENPPMNAVMLKGLIRKKDPSKIYISFIYQTAIQHLKAFLQERWGPNYAKRLEYNTSLFTGIGKWKDKRVTPPMIQTMMRELAKKTDILSKGRMKAADMNPLRPHALRASFSDRMAKAGANKLLVDFLMGHKMPFDSAYFGGEEGLREAYVKYANEVLEPRRIKSADELESELKQLIESQASHIQKLSEENKKLQIELGKVSRRGEQIQREFTGVKNLFHELVDTMVTDPKKRMRFTKYFTEAMERTDYDEEVKDEVWNFICTSIGKTPENIQDVRYTVSFENNKTVINIESYKENGSTKYMKFKGRIVKK